MLMTHDGMSLVLLSFSGCVRLTVVSLVPGVQVTISALNLQFQPNKLARSVEEAKLTAAEYTLTQIGFPVDGECV